MIDDTLNKEDELPKGYVLGGRYIIDKLIGKGGMANVYSADDKNLDRTVALKILHKKCSLNKQFVERFKREAKSAARLSHDNIVTVYDAGETDGKLFISMERVKGKTLDRIIEEQKTFFQPKEACIIMGKVLEGLDYAHSKGVIHRDIKPSNIIISENRDLKITDFGIAKIIEDKDRPDYTKLTQDFNPPGTPQYMAPEQIQQGEITGKTDVFSTGIVLYEMLTGILPFGNVNETGDLTKVSNILTKKLRGPKTINRRIPHKLEDIILKTLEKEPEKRYDAKGLYTALDSFIKDEKVRVEGSFRRRFEVNRRQFITKGALGLIGTSILIGTPIFFVIRNNAYEKSLYSTLDKIQKPEINSLEKINPLLEELNDKVYDRFEWMYDHKLVVVKNAQLNEEHPRIYPFGSYSPGRKREYFWLTGEGSTAGFIIPLFYYAFDEFNKRYEKTGKEHFKNKSQEFLDSFFYYSDKLYFVKNDDINLVMDRFHYPAEIVLTQLKNNHFDEFNKNKKEVDKIISEYAKALKIVIEKRYNPHTKFINRIDSNTPNNKYKVDAQKDFRIASMLCDGFRLLDLEKEVIKKHNDFIIKEYDEEYEQRIRTVKDYLSITINDADTKIKHLINPETGASDPISQFHAGLTLGFVHRINLLEDVINIYEGKEVTNPSYRPLIINTSKLDSRYIDYLKEKIIIYDKMAQKMIQYYKSRFQPSFIAKYYLGHKENNPTDNIATGRYLETIRIYRKKKIDELDREEIRFWIFKNLNSRKFISKNLGFVKGTCFNLTDFRGGTYIETDYFYLRNLREKK